MDAFLRPVRPEQYAQLIGDGPVGRIATRGIVELLRDHSLQPRLRSAATASARSRFLLPAGALSARP